MDLAYKDNLVVDSRTRGISGLTSIGLSLSAGTSMAPKNEILSGTSLIKFLTLELLLILGARNLDTVNNDGHVLERKSSMALVRSFLLVALVIAVMRSSVH